MRSLTKIQAQLHDVEQLCPLAGPGDVELSVEAGQRRRLIARGAQPRQSRDRDGVVAAVDDIDVGTCLMHKPINLIMLYFSKDVNDFHEARRFLY